MKNETICECGHIKFDHKYIGDWADDVVPPRACTYCDCGDYKQDEATARWWNTIDACAAMCKMTESFMLSAPYDAYCIERVYRAGTADAYAWQIYDTHTGDPACGSTTFDTPEAAFAWLKDHLKEQK